jgi:hypothetical protein
MNCALTQDYGFGNCETGTGGTKELWLIEADNVTSMTESSGTITSIQKASGKIFRKYQLVQETANFEEDIVGNVPNGTIYYDQKGTIVLNKQTVAIRNEILLLAKNRLIVIIHDNNEMYRLFGRSQGMRVLNGNAATGVAWGDRNGYTLNFTNKEPELAPFVDPAIIATLQNNNIVITYDTSLSFVSSTSDDDASVSGTSAATNANQLFEFNAIGSPVGTPASMTIKVGVTTELVIDFTTDYTGAAFRYTDNAGVQHTSVFTNGTVTF